MQSYLPAEITGHRIGGGVGCGRLTSTGAAEVSIDLLGGALRLWNAGANGPGDLDVGELAVRAVINLPSDRWSRWGLRFDGEMGAVYSSGWMGPTLRVNVGVDFETLVD